MPDGLNCCCEVRNTILFVSVKKRLKEKVEGAKQE